MNVGIKDTIRAAFHARPMGMWVPPNWVGLGLFALLGCVNPGFWVLGLGLEIAYLYGVGTHPRFRRVVEASLQGRAENLWTEKLERLVADLDPEDQRRYRALENRCRAILRQQSGASTPTALSAQGDGLRRLSWIYLRLLLTRESITRALRESTGPGGPSESLEDRIGHLENRLKGAGLSDELRKSLAGQIEILKQRQEKQREAREKLAFLEAELIRIQEQAELVREQAVLTTSPEVVSQRIDQISETLGGTTQWIQEQQRIYGSVEDLLEEPPPLSPDVTDKEAQ
jgi:hypothetical protein